MVLLLCAVCCLLFHVVVAPAVSLCLHGVCACACACACVCVYVCVCVCVCVSVWRMRPFATESLKKSFLDRKVQLGLYVLPEEKLERKMKNNLPATRRAPGLMPATSNSSHLISFCPWQKEKHPSGSDIRTFGLQNQKSCDPPAHRAACDCPGPGLNQ